VADSRLQTIAYPSPSSRPFRRDLDPLAPHVIVLFGATGDLSKRKLLPGLAYLAESALALAGIPRSQTPGGCWTSAAAMAPALLERLPAKAGLTFIVET